MSDSGSQSLLTVDDYRRLPVVPASRRYFYGAHPAQFGDLFLPETPGRYPVLTLIHGGCWRAEYGLEPLGQLAHAIAGRGVAVWSVEYRRLGDGGGWPATFLDAAAAVDFLCTLAGAHALDLSRIVTAGHSAGGHLALWLASRARLSENSPLFTHDPLPIHGVVSIAGIPDLAAAAVRNVCGNAAVELIGDMPDAAPGRYAAASPAALTPLGVPHIHIHGRKDSIVPVEMVDEFAVMATSAGDHATLVVLEDAGHFEPVDARTAAGQRVVDIIVDLLDAR